MKNQFIFFGIVFLILLSLWSPSLMNPSYLDNDVQKYALLSENIINSGTYSLLGKFHALYPPGHSLLAIPFILAFGKVLGFKILSFFWSFIFLTLSFYLIYDKKEPLKAYILVLLLLLNHIFVYNSMMGGSDIVFSAFFIFCLFSFKLAQKNKLFYVLTGIFLGLACLVRYAGVALFLIFGIYVLLDNYKKLFKKEFILMNLTAIFIICLWLFRNFLVFGNPFHTKYLSVHKALITAPSLGPLNSFFFYINPIHSIMPILFLFMIYGIIKTFKKNKLFLISILVYVSLYICWGINPRARHLLPLFPILLFFAIEGFKQLLIQYKKIKILITILFIIGVLMSAGMILIYSYGETNYIIDKFSNIIPKNLGLSSEQHYSIAQNIDYINRFNPKDSFIVLDELRKNLWYKEGVFRKDIILINNNQTNICSNNCYSIEKACKDDYLFRTDSEPKHCVKKLR